VRIVSGTRKRTRTYPHLHELNLLTVSRLLSANSLTALTNEEP